MIDSERLLQRFLRYVAVDTTADERAESYPSSPGQLALGRMLVAELHDLKLADARQDENGLVLATIPATAPGPRPVLMFNAHFDTSPESPGGGIQPQVIRQYAGGDIPLPGDSGKVIRVAENPELNEMRGRTLITTDGTTLLGGDDKAGIAVIVEMAAVLMANTRIPHGPIRILFTCDEEIGRGASKVDVAGLGAAAAYTLDGPGAGTIDTETFSADKAVVTIQGVNIHPSIARDRMVNAIKAAAQFVSRLPADRLCPEKTSGRDGFVHPYIVEGGVAEVRLSLILRDFDSAALPRQKALLEGIAAEVMRVVPGSRITVDTARQYRNMGEGLAGEPRAVGYVLEACRRLGLKMERSIIRGGTDGSEFTARGLPTPNLSTGQHNPHSPLEWACLDEMVQAAGLLLKLVEVWAEDPGV